MKNAESYFANLQLVLRTNQIRNEINWEEVPSPQKLAPFSFAAAAEVLEQDFDSEGEPIANGRFVLLYDPMGQDGWSGRFRIVTFIRANIEPELAADPALIDVGWSWLKEALGTDELSYLSESGTVTQIRSTSFGAIESRLDDNELEIRASWTPISTSGEPQLEPSEVVGHFNAWISILEKASGILPLPQGLTGGNGIVQINQRK